MDSKNHEKCYYLILLAYSLIALLVCMLSLASITYVGTNSIQQGINQTETNIMKTLNVTDLKVMNRTQIEYYDSVFVNMINWGLQRQVSWGTTALTFSALFLGILYELNKQTEETKGKPSQLKEMFIFRIPAISGAIFLVLAVISVFMISYYYREVAFFEGKLKSISMPTTVIYGLIKDWYIIELGTIIFVSFTLFIFTKFYFKTFGERKIRFATVFLVITVALISAILAYAFFVKLDIAVFLATAISALSYVLFTYWNQYVASPDLQITFDSSKPAEYTPQLLMLSSKDGTSMGNYRFIQAVINNRGSRLAHGCIAKIQLIERPPNCTMFSEEPKTLKWVDIPERNYIPPRGGNAVLGIAFSMERPLRIPGKRCAFQNEPDTVIRTYALTPEAFENPSIRAQDAFCIGDFKIRLTVYCEEGNTVSSDYVLEVSEEWQKLNMRTK